MDQKITEFLTRMGHFEEQRDAHFCIYRGICEEMEETEKFLDVTGDKVMEEIRKFEDFLERRVSKISKLKEPMKTSAERIFLFELVEYSFDVDKLIITGLEDQYRFVMTQLMWARVFPHYPAINSDEAFYSHLLSERFLTKSHGEGSFLSKLFSTAMCL